MSQRLNIYISVTLHSKLSFNYYIDATCKKANSVLSFIRRNLRHCQRRVKTDAYNSFVKPILNYAAPVWTPHADYYINKLEAIQKRAARFIMSDYRRSSSVTAMLNQLKWRPVEIQHRELRLLMFYKIINRLVELPVPEYIIPAPRVTRGNSMKFVQPTMHIDPYKYSFFPNTISQWNKLPLEIANTVDLNDFKNLL